MNIGDALKGVNLDRYYRLIVYLGAIAVFVGLLADVKVISNGQLVTIGVGLILLGFGEWRNCEIQPYISTNALLYETVVRRPKLLGIALDLIGLALIGWVVIPLIRAAIQ